MTEYLVSHGAAIGRGASAPPLVRGDRVVLRSARGLEVGEVLCEAGPDVPEVVPAVEVLRPATPDDVAADARSRRLAAELLAEVQRLIDAASLPLLPLDAAVSLDATSAEVEVLRWEACEVTPLREQLQRAFGFNVTLRDRSKADDHGCGGGCGSNCSAGGVKSADELTAYFARLRTEMHASGRIPLV